MTGSRLWGTDPLSLVAALEGRMTDCCAYLDDDDRFQTTDTMCGRCQLDLDVRAALLERDWRALFGAFPDFPLPDDDVRAPTAADDSPSNPVVRRAGEALRERDWRRVNDPNAADGEGHDDPDAEVIADLINAMRWWGAQEDGIPDEVWPVFSRAHMRLGWAMDAPDMSRALAARPVPPAPTCPDCGRPLTNARFAGMWVCDHCGADIAPTAADGEGLTEEEDRFVRWAVAFKSERDAAATAARPVPAAPGEPPTADIADAWRSSREFLHGCVMDAAERRGIDIDRLGLAYWSALAAMLDRLAAPTASPEAPPAGETPVLRPMTEADIEGLDELLEGVEYDADKPLLDGPDLPET